MSAVSATSRRIVGLRTVVGDNLCPACIADPDPRGPSACHACRELTHACTLTALRGLDLDLGVPTYARTLDLSDAHVDRVARRLFRAFDDASRDKEDMHDFDYEGEKVIKWLALAREAIVLGVLIAPIDAKTRMSNELRPREELFEEGHWYACSGCHELDDGYPTGPYSTALRCHLGTGCHECGGIGALWECWPEHTAAQNVDDD
jgi:hypothetical protein